MIKSIKITARCPGSVEVIRALDGLGVAYTIDRNLTAHNLVVIDHGPEVNLIESYDDADLAIKVLEHFLDKLPRV